MVMTLINTSTVRFGERTLYRLPLGMQTPFSNQNRQQLDLFLDKHHKGPRRVIASDTYTTCPLPENKILVLDDTRARDCALDCLLVGQPVKRHQRIADAISFAILGGSTFDLSRKQDGTFARERAAK
jgi:hypothetical protein